ncbi:MAG: HAMP domain-containing histidine kinase [Treponema sp.]|jgi:two-component system sensor histidine kinase VanS|nr:HAMP domain-containing histidine kinase [Treponema sp.]
MKRNADTKPGAGASVFARIFAYTMLLLALMSLAAVAVFARQSVSFYRAENRRQLALVFEPVIRQFEGKSPEEVAEIARGFYAKNQSLRFVVKDGGGEVLFSSPGAGEDGNYRLTMQFSRGPAAGDTAIGAAKGSYILLGSPPGGSPVDYGDLALKSFLALAIMIAIGVLGAVLFTRKVTGPLEEELARERVAEENQRLFFSAASHELKTPIAATEALIEGMIANIGDYRDHPKYLRECLKNLEAQNRLVSEILELARLSDGAAGPLPVALDLAELCAALAAEYRPLAEQGGVEIRADLPGFRVRADRGLLRRALSNVIANAVQNTPENGTARIGAERRGGKIRLSVLNSGARIGGESPDRLFEPFYRPDPARGRNRSGLGLAIVKKSLDRMGIPFGLENSSRGVLFWMDLDPA